MITPTMTNAPGHEPVMLKECISALQVQRGEGTGKPSPPFKTCNLDEGRDMEGSNAMPSKPRSMSKSAYWPKV